MRKHTLEATGGRTYAEKLAAEDPKTGAPASNPQRDIWVTSTALSTALHTAYFAESVSIWAIVTGFALLLTGVGFLVLTLKLLRPGQASEKVRRESTPVPAAS